MRKALIDGKTKEAMIILKACLDAHGLGGIVASLDSIGYKIHIKRKNITHRHELHITHHARQRTNNYFKMLGKENVDDIKLGKMIKSGAIVEYADLLAAGYRSKKENAERSTYVSINNDMVAVLEQDGDNVVWITTLSSVRTPKHRIAMTDAEFKRFCKNKSKK